MVVLKYTRGDAVNRNLKYITRNLLLILLIVVIVVITYVGFIGGPKRAYEKEDRLIVEAMMKKEGYSEARILSRFSYDDVYYITEVEIDEEPQIVWFTKDVKNVTVENYYELDRMHEIANKFNVNQKNISYGVYEDNLVYVLKNRDFEVFFRVDDLQVVYHLGSEI